MYDTATVDVPLIAAGTIALAGAAIHGGAGEVLVVRQLSPGTLPPTRFGGPGMTKTMIRAAWHMATIGLVTVASALLVSGSVLDGDAAQGVAVVGAGAATGLAALVLGLGARTQSVRTLFRHPGPALLTATAALAWWGAL
jgi:hypothetical protein